MKLVKKKHFLLQNKIIFVKQNMINVWKNWCD